MKRALEIYLVLSAAFCITGCVSNSAVVFSDVEMGEETNEGEMSVADLLANGKYAEAEQLARIRIKGGQHPMPYTDNVVKKEMKLESKHREFPPSSEADITMHRLNLCSVLLLEGNKCEAHKELLKVREEFEQMFDPDSQALKMTHGEREKFFKGDGYERATLYAFLGMSFLEMGDYANALKCIQSGILADSDAEKSEFRADYALLPYIGYVAASKAGENWHAEAQKYDKLVKELVGSAPSERPLPTALIVAWVGRGSDRTLGGEFSEKRFVRKGSSRGLLDALTVNVGSDDYISYPHLADLTYQATTRGGRVMDLVLDRKATAKRGLAASANVLLSFGAGCFEAGAASGRIGVMTVMYSVGGLCVGLGGVTHLIGMVINSTADDRCWQALPGRLIVVPLDVPHKRMQVKLRGYRRLDNILSKGLDVDFSDAKESGVPVCHVSLIVNREEIEHVIQDGLTRSADDIAARTKENSFADKIELTKEDD